MEEQLEGGRLHPLLVPSVVKILAEYLHPRDAAVCRLVCKLWNTTIRREKHALVNPRILSTVIKHLHVSCFLPFRLVCTYWNETLTNSPRWKLIDIDHPSWASCFHTTLVVTENLQGFMDKFGSPESLPLPLAFTHFTATNDISLSDDTTQEFLNLFGRHLKSLELYRCKWTLEDLRHVLFQCTTNLESLQLVCGVLPGTQVGRGRKVAVAELECVLHEDPSDFPVLPRLKKLQIDMNILDSKDRVRAYVEQFFTELFSSTPNLEAVNFDFSSWYARSWTTNFIASSSEIRLDKLRVLEHLIDPNLTGIFNLTNKRFPLSKLKIRIRYKDVTVEALHELLRSLSGTLTDLQVVYYDSKCAREFPSSRELVNLRNLELWKFKGQLGFLTDFSGLERLVLGEVELKGQDVFCSRDVFKEMLGCVSVTFKDYWEVRVFS